jgi:hypothetical protein
MMHPEPSRGQANQGQSELTMNLSPCSLPGLLFSSEPDRTDHDPGNPVKASAHAIAGNNAADSRGPSPPCVRLKLGVCPNQIIGNELLSKVVALLKERGLSERADAFRSEHRHLRHGTAAQVSVVGLRGPNGLHGYDSLDLLALMDSANQW